MARNSKAGPGAGEAIGLADGAGDGDGGRASGATGRRPLPPERPEGRSRPTLIGRSPGRSGSSRSCVPRSGVRRWPSAPGSTLLPNTGRQASQPAPHPSTRVTRTRYRFPSTRSMAPQKPLPPHRLTQTVSPGDFPEPSAPRARSKPTTSACPALSATSSGVRPSRSRASGSAPAARSTPAASLWPASDAAIRGVQPFGDAAFGSAPSRRRALTCSTLPLAAGLGQALPVPGRKSCAQEHNSDDRRPQMWQIVKVPHPPDSTS